METVKFKPLRDARFMLQNIHIRHVRYMYTCQQVLRPQVQVQVQVLRPQLQVQVPGTSNMYSSTSTSSKYTSLEKLQI